MAFQPLFIRGWKQLSAYPCILKAMREWRLLPYIIYNQHGEAAR